MKLALCIALLIARTITAFAQTGTLTGRVVEAGQLRSLPFAAVYLDRTTIGTTTNEAGEFTLPAVPVGSQKLVISFVGFVAQVVSVQVKAGVNTPVRVLLVLDARQVAEVQIKATHDKTWARQLKRFEKVFLGNTAACKLLNPWAIDFAEDGVRLTASAAVPLAIDNNELGYRLSFDLKTFASSPTDFAIVGTVRFTDMETTDTLVIRRWQTNRERAYRGSVRHLIKALIDGKPGQAGFALYRDKEPGKPRSDNFDFERRTNLVDAEKSLTVSRIPGTSQYYIALDGRVEIHYVNGYTTAGFYKDTSAPVSWLEARRHSLLADSEGNLLNPTDVVVSGSMAGERVSAMLPINYRPGRLMLPVTSVSGPAARLRESVYLHTDRPYYRPGETLWFSAYRLQPAPGLGDSLGNVLYVDLIAPDRTIVQQRVLLMDNGRTAGSIRLPQPTGSYVLRAYTQWMRNYGIDQFFYRPVPVLLPDVRTDSEAPAVTDSLLTLTFDRPDYKKRSQVGLTLRVGTTSKPVKGSVSVSVYDQTTTAPPAGIRSIKTRNGPNQSVPSASETGTYAPENGLTLNGVYADRNGKKGKTTLTLVPQTMNAVYSVPTQADGSFSLRGMYIADSTTLIIQPPGGTVRWVTRELPSLPAGLPTLLLKLMRSADRLADTVADTLSTRTLDAVDVMAKKRVASENGYAQADAILTGSAMNRYASVAEAIDTMLPGFTLISDQNIWYLVWTRAASGIPNSTGSPNEPNLYIDDVQVRGITVGERLMQLSPTLIDHVEVNGMITANQGANGSNGLINVYMKRPTEHSSPDLSTTRVGGFARPVLFQSADTISPANATDYRPTVYWNPRVSLEPYQSVTLHFFTSDQPGLYRVVVEGLTSSGTPIHSEAVFTVQK